MKIHALIISAILMGSISVKAEEEVDASSVEATFDQIMDSIEDAIPERTTTGRIQSIDLAARTAIIGGYKYHFGPASDAFPLQVKLLGKDFGSLELLAPGMDVEIYYILTPGEHRVGNELIQIESSEQH